MAFGLPGPKKSVSNVDTSLACLVGDLAGEANEFGDLRPSPRPDRGRIAPLDLGRGEAGSARDLSKDCFEAGGGEVTEAPNRGDRGASIMDGKESRSLLVGEGEGEAWGRSENLIGDRDPVR